jgi:SAM-dependent methyltransferase
MFAVALTVSDDHVDVPIENPFGAASTAERYALGRPYHHARTLRRALGGVTLSGTAIDVACGTGLSTRALAELGFDAIGVDVAPEMVAIARASTELPFARGAAEHLPVRSGAVDLISVGSGVHWFDREAFDREARRVLRPGGLVVLYEHAAPHLPEDESFVEWIRSVYIVRYPTPPRGAVAGRADVASSLHRVNEARWLDTVSFSHAGLVDYLMTQSNVVEAIESGRETAATVRSTLVGETSRFFSSVPTRDFAFRASMELLRSGGEAAAER